MVKFGAYLEAHAVPEWCEHSPCLLRFTPPCRIAALQGEPARQLQEAEEGSQWFVDYWIVCSSLLQLLKAIAQKKAALAEQQQS